MTAPISAIVDRAAIRADWDAMRADFHALADALTETQWNQKSISTDWTNGELLTHFVITVGLFPQMLASARKGAAFLNLPGGLVHPFSFWLTRVTAAWLHRDGLKQRFEREYAVALRDFDGVRDSEWRAGAEFFGEGFRDIEWLCRRPVQHWQEHGGHVRQGAGVTMLKRI